MVCTYLISAYRNNFCREKKKRPATSPTHPLCITWLYTSYIYTDNKVKLSTKVNTSRWGTFKVHHHPQSTWLYTYIYTDNKVKLSVYPYKRMGIVTTASHHIFPFLCIPLFIFSSLILSSKPNICGIYTRKLSQSFFCNFTTDFSTLNVIHYERKHHW